MTVPLTVDVLPCPKAVKHATLVTSSMPSVIEIQFARRLCLFMFPPVERVVLKLRFLKLTVIPGALSTNESLLLPDAKLARKNRNYREDLPVVQTNMMVSCEDHALIVPSKKIISRSKKLADFDNRDMPGKLQRSENLALNPKSWIDYFPIILWNRLKE